MFKKTILALAGALTLTLSAVADVLDQSLVPAEARWLAHLDVTAARSSTLAEILQTLEPEAFQEEIEIDLDDGRAVKLDINPWEDLRSVTIYSTDRKPEQAVVVITATAKADALLDLLPQIPGYHTMTEQGYLLHTACEDGGEHEAYAHVVETKGGALRRILLSNDPEALVNGIRVIEGQAPSLRGSRRPALTAAPQRGSILFAATAERLSQLDDVPEASAVAKLAKSFVLDIGESGGVLDASLVVETDTVDESMQIAQVIQGATALLGLVSASEVEDVPVDELRLLLRALTVEARGAAVVVNFSYDTMALFGLVQRLEEY